MEEKKFVDIDKLLKEKARRLHRILPGFAVSWLKRKLHEEEINSAMKRFKNDRGLAFNKKVLDYLGATVESVNSGLIPETGNLTVAANHPLGGLDGLALIDAVGNVRQDVHFFVNDILKKVSNYGDVFVAVNKLGRVSAGSLRTMEEIFRSGAAVLIFPAGLVSRKEKGLIRDLSWKKSFVTQAIDHKRLIQPAFIEGQNSRFFYNFTIWRKRFGIKGNLEMLFLPDEMFSARKKTIRIHFSKPFSYEIFDQSRSHKEWADLVYQYVYSPDIVNGISFEEYLLRSKGAASQKPLHTDIPSRQHG